ncbi:hypothetical protein METP3_01113 [Methanosarcinales archaeon]|nr:hypothetical protein METP3_01113 [Methanosarcinales archaeon]
MAQYLIKLPHTEAECLKALDEIAEKGSKLLPKIYWGCAAGDHTGYAIVDAKSESDAKGMIEAPTALATASVIEVKKHTVEEIASFHKK